MTRRHGDLLPKLLLKPQRSTAFHAPWFAKELAHPGSVRLCHSESSSTRRNRDISFMTNKMEKQRRQLNKDQVARYRDAVEKASQITLAWVSLQVALAQRYIESQVQLYPKEDANFITQTAQQYWINELTLVEIGIRQSCLLLLQSCWTYQRMLPTTLPVEDPCSDYPRR
jgi:hypothetical protein